MAHVVERKKEVMGEGGRKKGKEKYRAEKKSLQILLSSTQAGPGRKAKKEQDEISRNHVQAFFPGPVVEPKFAFLWAARSGTEKGGRGASHLKLG